MSKNVAVFVDVANIFYAAKAAGVDIDYVTLLKSATAGRDFVRAYAYTGLDPDNDNQRQFHQFLARHDYKVVSKDIRKYGDGKVKANLDIELVVDLMKTARNLDIAVVVSGDGDFAPAIRAVQEMGVRVEVISFRGNTSSDLMDVADVFTDITQIARVEKESSRSGRRVAAEDDLSMTAVPDKQSEGAPRRRRTTRARPEREEPVAAEPRRGVRRAPVVEAAPVAPEPTGTVVALPGERLSRAAARPAARPAAEVEGPEPEMESDEEPVAAGGRVVELDADGVPRRRRRRGGRGRGRGRGERPLPGEQPVTEAGEIVEEEIVDYSAPRAPQPSAFGSIWDSQLGVPSTPILAGEQLDDVPDDEPEIPEYLLAERRQQRGAPPRVGGRGGRGRGGAYQVALDRERFGRSGAPSGGGTGNFNSGPRPSRAAVPRGPRPDRGPRQDRPPRQYTEAPRRESDGSPWSEVPPELEAQLRAELARRPAREAAPAPARSQAAPALEPVAKAAAAPRRPRATRKTGDEAPAAAQAAVPAASEVEAKPRRARTAAKKVEAAAPVVQADAPEKPKRTRAPRKAAPEA